MEISRHFLEIEAYGHGLTGRLAINQGFINSEQLLTTLKIQHRNPDAKIGEILVEQKYMTVHQLANLLEYQQTILAHAPNFREIPDTFFRASLSYPNIKMDIEAEAICRAEKKRQELFLDETDLKSLQQILLDASVISLEDIPALCQKIDMVYGKCPCCSRDYHLFNYEDINPVRCPVCWTVDLIAGNEEEAIIAPLYEQPEMSEEDVALMQNSPEFNEAYQSMKKMEPALQEKMTQKWFRNENTIKKVFAQMTRIYMPQELRDPLLDFQPKIPRKQEEKASDEQDFLPTATEEPLIDSDGVVDEIPVATTIDKVVSATRRFFNREEKEKAVFTFARDIAQLRHAYKQGYVTEDDIVEAVIHHSREGKEQGRRVMEILQERSPMKPEHWAFLQKIQGLRARKMHFYQSKIELQLCQHLEEYNILPRAEIQRMLRIQVKLYHVGIIISLDHLLVKSRLLSQEMMDGLLLQCLRLLGYDKKKSQQSPKPKAKQKHRSGKSYKMQALQARQRRRHPLYILVCLLLIGYLGYKALDLVISASQSPQEKTTTSNPRPKQQSPAKLADSGQTNKQKPPVAEMSKPKPQENSQASKQEQAKLIMRMVGLLLPRFYYLTNMIEKNYDIYLTRSDFNGYHRNHQKWLILNNNSIKDLPPLASTELDNRVTLLHEVSNALTEFAESLDRYLNNHQDSKKDFKETLKSSGTWQQVQRIRQLFLQLNASYRVFSVLDK